MLKSRVRAEFIIIVHLDFVVVRRLTALVQGPMFRLLWRGPHVGLF